MNADGSLEFDTQLLETTLEGMGSRSHLALEPAFVSFAGQLLSGKAFEQEVR